MNHGTTNDAGANAGDIGDEPEREEEPCAGCGKMHKGGIPPGLLDILPPELAGLLREGPGGMARAVFKTDIRPATAVEVADLVGGFNHYYSPGDRVVLTERGAKEYRHPKAGEVCVVTAILQNVGDDHKNITLGMMAGDRHFDLPIDSRLVRPAPDAAA